MYWFAKCRNQQIIPSEHRNTANRDGATENTRLLIDFCKSLSRLNNLQRLFIDVTEVTCIKDSQIYQTIALMWILNL
jgi:hypothetical protein